ncbi:MAG TPA: LuxR C-terminal-related transcriptional regulator [Propionibacteriaceae bacterium]|nr:LuxR C-terminal-related transcriptional regulator [Propionibacteriaceae bacterium]
MESDDALGPAAESLALGTWEQARRQLTRILAEHESPEALEGMGTALWWLGDIQESVNYRKRAYAGYRAVQRNAEATMVALDISVCFLSNLDNPAVAQGWISRARSTAALSGEERLVGWLWLMEGYTCGDLQHQRKLLSRVLDLARRLPDADLELSALADLGLAMVTSGDISAGLALLDEAMAGTLAGECARLDTVVWASCSMLRACGLAADHKRAAEWCTAAESFAAKYGCPFLDARCRAHYGRVLVGTGRWAAAEVELTRALSMAADLGREPRVVALAGLAELRLRRGAVEEAVELLAMAGDALEIASVYAEVMIAAGYPERAIAVLRSQLVSQDENDAAFPILTAGLVDAYLASGDTASAATATSSLPGVSHEHSQALALTERATGLVAAAQGELDLAATRLRRAAAEFDRLELPFHAARARFELARVVRVGDQSLAIVEASWALDRLERLGAHRDAAAAAALLRSLGVATRPGPRQIGLLSQREREVLALLKRGLTNPEIADELFISPRTAAHHVSRILAKLNLRSRAEAAAYAAGGEALQV